jgi:hypothetical protein
MNTLKETHYLGQLTKLKKFGTIEEFISTFEFIPIYTECMSDTFFKEFFIIGLKERIHAQVLMAHPTSWLEASQRAQEAQKVANAQIKKTLFPHPHPTISPPTNLSSSSPPLKIHKLTCTEILLCQLKGLYYNYVDKYFHRHTCKESKHFMAILEENLDDEVEVIPPNTLPPPVEDIPPSTSQDVEKQISMYGLTGISAPQTLKLIGYIKHCKFIILIGNGSTHNRSFIDV